MKPGSILLELLIASAIASFVGVTLFNIFYQSNIAFATVDRIASIDVRACILQNQFERDLSGAFVVFEKKKKKVEPGATPQKQSKEKGGQIKKETGKQYEDLPIKKAFHSKNRDGVLDLLTCITSNPIPAYNKVRPRIARVIYTLVVDKDAERKFKRGEKVYKLFREESRKLAFSSVVKESKDRAEKYEVVSNIKSLSVEYVVKIDKKEKKDKQGKSEGKSKVEYKTFSKWTKEEIKKTKKQKPDLCVCKVAFWDNLIKRSEEFEFKIYTIHDKIEPFKPKGLQPKNTKTQLVLRKKRG